MDYYTEMNPIQHYTKIITELQITRQTLINAGNVQQAVTSDIQYYQKLIDDIKTTPDYSEFDDMN